ncbi:hypothetical protein C8Q73DRAFT_770645 [Cubamyces lactineus]|nr:hypothetical protein C8Q73DRAFT_770645 [Cubamyces lactineus]
MASNTTDLAFPAPFEFQEREPVTVVERRMRIMSFYIRIKPDWWMKVNDPEIVAKWRAEMIEQDAEALEELWGGEKRFDHGNGEKPWPREPVTDTQLDYIFDQLKYEASRRDETTGIYATTIPRVYETRSLIPSTLKAELVQAVSTLEDVPNEQKDWHPGSEGQVLDLVHPSLYCLCIGRTWASRPNPRLLDEDTYQQERADLVNANDYAVSSEYQWLPTDFKVSETGEVTSLGYINNIHPTHHRALHNSVTRVLGRFIPLFDKVLSDLLNPEPPLAIKADPATWYDYLEGTEPQDLDEDELGEAECDRLREHWERTMKWPFIPEPEPFSPPNQEGRVEFSLKRRTVQVIVKLANIVLTPENPVYHGGAWHVEGMANEKIVATGIYYYACENITQSDLDFRQTTGSHASDLGVCMNYQNDDHKGWVAAYGLGRDLPLSQQIGCIRAEEDKCIAFPNIYQHHVDGFTLEDPSRPGYRKILAFFLVDPLTRIHSTTDVPPQQREWLEEVLAEIPRFQALPAEIVDMIVRGVDCVVSREQAEEDRLYLMQERGQFTVEHNEQVFEIGFAMCEH